MAIVAVSDADLLEAWATGDRRAGSHLIDRHFDSITRFFANKTARAVDVEDLVSSTFEECVKNLDRFRRASSFRTFLFGIARNVLRHHYRRRARKEGRLDFESISIVQTGGSPSVVAATRQEHRLLLEALRCLPLAQQELLELSYFEELSRAQIAEIVGLPPGTVASRLRRAREDLEKEMARMAPSQALLTSTLTGFSDWCDEIRKKAGRADQG